MDQHDIFLENLLTERLRFETRKAWDNSTQGTERLVINTSQEHGTKDVLDKIGYNRQRRTQILWKKTIESIDATFSKTLLSKIDLN